MSDEETCQESDEHLPLVRVELDRLNYANESINNLELELEEAKREFLRIRDESDYELNLVEKKLGTCVAKARPYYEERMALIDANQKYLSAKIQFETAQELYVAAKNMQMYAEESLDQKEQFDQETLLKMLKMAKIKVTETEFSKQSCDIQQIEAYKAYEARLRQLESTEKDLKRSIEKSTRYFEEKAFYNKELKFFYAKIEGLKSCLKEAKLAYQQSLINLEKISTEVHEQRKVNANQVSSNSSTSSMSSLAATASLSSPNLTSLGVEQAVKKRSNSLSTLDETVSCGEQEEEDYDKYFNNVPTRNNSGLVRNFTKTIQFSQKLDKYGISLLSDEEIEHLRLDKKFKRFEDELRNNRRQENGDESLTQPSSVTTTPNRPQFRVPNIFVLKSNKK